MNFVLLGPPGAGKGTLAALLKKEFGLMHLSTGDLLRDEIKKKTEIGREAKASIDKGELVSDELVTRLIRTKVMEARNEQGFLFDGFPRTAIQAEDLTKILREIHKVLDYALSIDATVSVIIQRLGGRRVCRVCGAVCHVVNRPSKRAGICDVCGGELYQRADDNAETIKTRMDVYTKSSKPIVEYYKKQGTLMRLDGDKDSEILLDELLKFFHENGKLHNH